MLESNSRSVQAMTAYHVGELGLRRFAPRLRALADEGIGDAERSLERLASEDARADDGEESMPEEVTGG